MTACDPARISTLRVTPVSPESNSSAPPFDRLRAVAALDHVSAVFGLVSQNAKNCIRAYHVSHLVPLTPERSSQRDLSLCITQASDTAFGVRVVEFITFDWSPKADSLRTMLADSLSAVGIVSVDGKPYPDPAVKVNARPPNEEL